MEEHVFNLYPVANQHELAFSYRLVEVEGDLGAGSDDPDLPLKNLHLLTKRIAFGQQVPVAIVQGGDKPVLAVAADRPFERRDYQLTPHVVSLRPKDEVHQVRFAGGDGSALGIAFSFLAWEVRGHLFKRRDLWQSGPNTFFSKKPVNAQDPGRQFHIYGGFSPRFLLIDGVLHVAVPVQYFYTDAKWADRAFSERDLQRLGGRRMLYHFGQQVYPVKFQRRTGKTIKEQTFCSDDGKVNSNVFDWTVSKAGAEPCGRRLEPGSAAIRYKNIGNDKERFGARSLCKLILHNEDPRVASSRREHQRTPQERIDAATAIVTKYLTGLRLGDVELKISPTARKRQGKRFGYPAIRLGNGRVLRVGRNSKDGEIPLEELGRTRGLLLEDKSVGLAVLSDLVDQVLIVPRSLGIPIANDLKARIEAMVSALIRKPYTMQLVRYSDESKRTLKDQVDSVVASLNESSFEGGRGVLVLPARAQSDLHNYIKKKLRKRVQFQCMSTEKLCSFYRVDGNPGNGKAQSVQVPSEGRLRSYLFNMAMGLMIVNRQWPWVLEKETHYDAYIGLDVLDHTAAFTFFYDGGRVCAMRDQESSHKEKLPRGLVCKLVCEGLKEDLPDLDQEPRSLVLRRDGRLYESEWLGFNDAVKKLVDEGLLPRDILVGAVEVPKHRSYGVRLALSTSSGLENPTLGSWEVFSKTEGIVCTTGWPFNIPGTVEPLVILLARGNLDLVKILEDTFRMAQLCWPTPTGCMRLPVDLKLCDEHLRACAGRADEDKALFGESEEEEDEPLLTAAK
ncbi:MAG: hypothetical protein ABSH34_13165 [Verrucomicrobiota bacterium]|jgi:hypothetical protein